MALYQRICKVLFLCFIFMSSICLPCGADEITVRVALGFGKKLVTFSGSSPIVVKDAQSGQNITAGADKVDLTYNDGKLAVNGSPVPSKSLIIMPAKEGSPLCMGDSSYRGDFLAVLDEGKGLTIINNVSLEYYIQGVLGGEISAGWPMESIKAQAVAARTYALYKMQSNKGRIYDLVNNTADQMYVGIRGEGPRFVQAVSETKGEVLARDSKVICAYYHSNCGGATSHSKMIFVNGSAVLYGTKDSFCAGAPNSIWSLSLTGDSIKESLNKNGIGAGKIYNIKPYYKDEAGRVVYLQIDHEYGTMYLTGEDFRKYIGYRTLRSTKFNISPSDYLTYMETRRSAWSGGGPFSASLHKIAPSLGRVNLTAVGRVIPSKYDLTGSGWGHGVGMCQWGARGMAKAGYNYKQILAYYYPETQVCKAVKK